MRTARKTPTAPYCCRQSVVAMRCEAGLGLEPKPKIPRRVIAGLWPHPHFAEALEARNAEVAPHGCSFFSRTARSSCRPYKRAPCRGTETGLEVRVRRGRNTLWRKRPTDPASLVGLRAAIRVFADLSGKESAKLW